MKRLAIIPARSGSKRLPGKNIKDFCGKPIISYPIAAALASGLFDEVMVSTDSEEIAEIGRRFGASVPFLRSEAASRDFAIDLDVQEEVLREYEKRGAHFDQMVYIYPCNPFVTVKHLTDAVLKLEKCGAAILFPVAKYSDSPYRSYYIDENDRLRVKFPEYTSTRTQDLPALYHDCGMFYAFNLSEVWGHGESQEEHRQRLLNNRSSLVISEDECQDIDTAEDWIVAEQKYRIMHGLV